MDSRYADNVEGAYYVTENCINCDLCAAIAPEVFKSAVDGSHCIVFAQPESEEDVSMALDALSYCPVEAINNDG